MSPETLIDERFDELVAALRAETPSTPDSLRDRVAAVTATRPPEPRFSARRVVALAVPVAAAASLAVAFAVGVNTAMRPGGSSGDAEMAAPAQPGETLESSPPPAVAKDKAWTSGAQRLAPTSAAVPGPTRGRAQDFTANLRLFVDGTDDLSATTQRALRTTRRLGGYVAAVEYRTPRPGEGTADVRLRIPVSRVQAAIVELSSLGRILAQDTRISDLQQPLDQLTRRIRRLERRATEATGAERARLLAEIAALRRQRAEVTRRAAFAKVNLELTTREPRKAEAAPGRIERAIDDAAGVLAAELAIGAYVLIVASPLLLLLLAAFLGSRTYRRYADHRLLERA